MSTKKIRKRFNNYTLFTIIVILFPILLKVIKFLSTNGFRFPTNLLLSIVNVLIEYTSFYITAFGFVFAVYQFNQGQNKTEQDRINQRVKEIKDSTELKLKELDFKKDYYRPTFIINSEGIQLVMRDSKLFFESIRYYQIDENGEHMEFLGVKKSGELLKKEVDNQFFILGETIVGESIIFGNLNGNIKIYKYLIEGGNPLIPRGTRELSKAEKIWGNYNSVNGYDKKLERIFYINSAGARESFIFTNSEAIKDILGYESVEEFFRGIFCDLLNEGILHTYTQGSVVKTCRNLLEYWKYNPDIFERFEIDNKDFRFSYLSDTVEVRLTYLIPNYNKLFISEETPVPIYKVVSHILNNLDFYKINDQILGELLRILAEIFENAKIQISEYDERDITDNLVRIVFNSLEFTKKNKPN